jgi:hypothetical protein
VTAFPGEIVWELCAGATHELAPENAKPKPERRKNNAKITRDILACRRPLIGVELAYSVAMLRMQKALPDIPFFPAAAFQMMKS